MILFSFFCVNIHDRGMHIRPSLIRVFWINAIVSDFGYLQTDIMFKSLFKSCLFKSFTHFIVKTPMYMYIYTVNKVLLNCNT